MTSLLAGLRKAYSRLHMNRQQVVSNVIASGTRAHIRFLKSVEIPAPHASKAEAYPLRNAPMLLKKDPWKQGEEHRPSRPLFENGHPETSMWRESRQEG